MFSGYQRLLGASAPRHLLASFIFCLGVSAGSHIVTNVAHAAAANEYVIKAAFLLNFLKFSELPARDPAVVLVCTYQDQEAYTATKILDGKRVGSREVKTASIKTLRDVQPCDALFIPLAADDDGLDLVALGSQALLTVGEAETFIERGGMISFTEEDERIGFMISNENGAKAKIKFSAKLLALGVVSK